MPDHAALVLALCAVTGAVAFLLTGWFRRYAMRHRLLDVPNDRSSHTVVTPRGGGAAIVLSVLPAIVLLGAFHVLEWRAVWGITGGGALVAAIGLIDDTGHVPARWRLLGHFSAAAWALWWLGGLPLLTAFGAVRHPGWVGGVVAALFLVWLVNLMNFMDGIDGIAGMETITVCFGGIVAAFASGSSTGVSAATAVLAMAVLGFLLWNWPPAKIFLGDCGSGFLGMMIGSLAIVAAWGDARLFWAWAILVGVFAVDATVTLVRRVLRGERFYEAHRSHAYQRAAVRAGAHRPVTLAVAAINVGWLLPVAVLAGRGAIDGATGVVIAYAPLIVAALWLRAGTTS